MAEETTNTEAAATPAAVEAAPAQNANSQETAPQSASASRNQPLSKAPSDLGPDLAPVNPDEPRKEVENGRSYEITYIVIAGDQGAIDETQASLKTLIEDKGGAIDNVRVSEVRRLAYEIQKRMEGVYIVINARFSKDLTLDLERFFKLDERVLRHIVLRDTE